MTIVILLIITIIIGIIIIIITVRIMICNNLGVIRDTDSTWPVTAQHCDEVMKLCERVNTGEHGAWWLRCRHSYTHSTLASG